MSAIQVILRNELYNVPRLHILRIYDLGEKPEVENEYKGAPKNHTDDTQKGWTSQPRRNRINFSDPIKYIVINLKFIDLSYIIYKKEVNKYVENNQIIFEEFHSYLCRYE